MRGVRARAVAALLPVLVPVLAAVLAAAALPARAHADVAQLAGFLTGEWNNNEQVWQQRIDVADPKVATKPVLSEHLHHVVFPLEGSALGPRVLFVQPAAGEDPASLRAPYVLRLSPDAAGAVRVERLALRDSTRWSGAHRRADTAAALTAAELSAEGGCTLVARFDPARAEWAGGSSSSSSSSSSNNTSSSAAACAAMPTLSASAERWATGATASRKVRYYTGWVWFRNAGPGSSADDKDTSFTARFLLHNEGQKMTVLRKDGSESPWALELAVLTYQNTRKPILKLALLDRATGRSISYTWTDTDGRALGINLGWFQAGMTLKAENASFGF